MGWEGRKLSMPGRNLPSDGLGPDHDSLLNICALNRGITYVTLATTSAKQIYCQGATDQVAHATVTR